MNKKIVFAIINFAVGLFFYNYVSSFDIYSYDSIILAILVMSCIGFVVTHKDWKDSVRLIWLISISSLGLLVIFGLVNEWLTNLEPLIGINHYLLLILSCIAGFAFFSMMISKEEEFFNIVKSNKSSKYNVISFVLNVAFWLILILGFNAIPWYVHVTLAILATFTSFYSGYDENKKIAEGIDKILLFFTMFAHFCAESAISGVGVVRKFAPFVAVAHFSAEAVCDLEALLDSNHVDSNHGDEHLHSHNKIYNIIWFIASFCFSFCCCVLGYFEIPKAMSLIGINNNSIGARVMLITILILGGLSCLSVNYNCNSGGSHEHLNLTPFKTISDKGFSFELPAFEVKKAVKAILSFFGAILNSTVGVIIAAQVFSLPVWLMAVLVVLAFITEFAFHYCNQYDVSSGHGHQSCKIFEGGIKPDFKGRAGSCDQYDVSSGHGHQSGKGGMV